MIAQRMPKYYRTSKACEAQWCLCCMPGGKGAGAAIDPVGGKMTGKLVASLADGGKYMLYGALAAGEPCEVCPVRPACCEKIALICLAIVSRSAKSTLMRFIHRQDGVRHGSELLLKQLQ